MFPATDKRMQFIGGLEAYEEAGGQVQRELFDDRNAGYAMDVALVEKLVAEKLEAAAATVRAEGWKWVECSATAPAGYHGMERHYPEAIPLSEEDRAALDAAQAEYDELAELIEGGMADDEAEAKLAEVEKRIDALNARTEAYSPEALEQAGTFVFLDYYGRLAIERGFVKPEAAAEDEDSEGLPSVRGAAKPKVPMINHSAALIEDLTAHKTAALRIELANNPDVALVAVVHAMLLSVAYPYNSEQSALQFADARTAGAVDEGRRKLQRAFRLQRSCGQLWPSPAGKPCRSVRLAVGAAARHGADASRIRRGALGQCGGEEVYRPEEGH
ncbi:hypothetical protein [Ensifer aridi]|uniref:hypothetical protein n=1 Tax=Ensifer aridi TaxID=1708715 RepID=UPI001FCD9B07|nr:hypothetical protein [Ensifer aridi]